MQKLKFLTYLLLCTLIVNLCVRVVQRCGADAILQMVYSECDSLCWWQRMPYLERIVWAIADRLE